MAVLLIKKKGRFFIEIRQMKKQARNRLHRGLLWWVGYILYTQIASPCPSRRHLSMARYFANRGRGRGLCGDGEDDGACSGGDVSTPHFPKAVFSEQHAQASPPEEVAAVPEMAASGPTVDG